MLYSLQVISNNILENVKPPIGEPALPSSSWNAAFIAKGGLAHCFSVLIKLPIGSLGQALTRKCFAQLFLLMVKLLMGDLASLETLVPNFAALRSPVMERILTVLEACAHYSITPEEPVQPSLESQGPPSGQGATKAESEESDAQSQAVAQKKKLQAEQGLGFMNGLKILKQAGKPSHYLDTIFAYPGFGQLLQDALLLSSNPLLSTVCSQEVAKMAEECAGHHRVLPLFFKTLLPHSLKIELKTHHFFKCLRNLVNATPKEDFARLDLDCHTLLQELVEHVKAHETKEKSATDTDFGLIGLLDLLAALLKKLPQEKLFVGQGCGLLTEVLHSCLFEFPSPRDPSKTVRLPPPKCKSKLARESGFELLCTLARDTLPNLKQIIEGLLPLHVYFSCRQLVARERGGPRTRRTG